VARNSESLTGDWTRSFSERSQLAMDANWIKVRYDQPASLNDISYNLVDYRYLSGGPSYSYFLTERDTFKVLANVGHYQSLNGITASKSDSLQVGFVHLLSEIWTLSVNAGYSGSTNSEKLLNEALYYYYGIIEYETESVETKWNGLFRDVEPPR
jgi:hypothetical protein